MSTRLQKINKYYNKTIIIILLFIFFVFGFWLRSYKLPTFLHCESWDITNAIRLHYLPFLNINETIRFNFFKSFLMGFHGVTDFLYMYLVTGVYDLLGIPISEHYIYLAQVVLGMVFILFLIFFTFLLFGKNLNIALFVMIFAVLNFDHIVVMSRTQWHYNSTKLLELLTYLVVFFRSISGKKIIWDVLLGGLMFLNALTANIVIVPMVFLLQYLLYLEREGNSRIYSIGGFARSLMNFREIIIWLPFMFGLVIDYFVQKTIGVSGLGMFGHVTRSYGFNPFLNISKGLINAKKRLIENIDYFYNIVWIFSVLGGVFCIISGKFKDFAKRYLFFIFLFIYHTGILILFGQFYWSELFIPIVILGGVGLYYTLETINAISINKLRKAIYYPLLTIIIAFVFIIGADRVNLASKRDNGLNLIPFVPSFNDTYFDSFYNRINPIKTVGYYLRKNTSINDRIYMLFGGDAWAANAEYYFGKKAMMTESGVNKQIFFKLGHPLTLEFYKQRDGVDVFDYYIVIESLGYSDYDKNVLKEAEKKGVKKVADIIYEDKVYASIYSPKNSDYEVLRMEDYDKKWDKEYANLKNIYENKLVGLVSLWGLY